MNIKALYKSGYGVYVVTSKKDDRINGQIANIVFQVTSESPTVIVSINKNNLARDSIKESRGFSASVLCQDTPLTFIVRFGFRSGRDTDKFEGINYKIGETGASCRSERVAKYNWLLEIEEELGQLRYYASIEAFYNLSYRSIENER